MEEIEKYPSWVLIILNQCWKNIKVKQKRFSFAMATSSNEKSNQNNILSLKMSVLDETRHRRHFF